MASSTFECEACGRSFAWKPKLAGRVARCRCGQKVRVPERDPAEAAGDPGGSGTIPLAEPEPGATPGRAAADGASAARCVKCNAPLKPGAVLCINCGTDQTTGRKLDTSVDPLSKQERAAGRAPIRGLKLVRVGLWFSLVGIVLTIGGMLGAAAVPFAGVASDAVLIGLAIAVMAGTVAQAIGPLLCLGVPGEAAARGILVLSIVLHVIAAGIGGAAEVQALPAYLGLPASLLSVIATICFLAFFYKLAAYLGFEQVEQRAASVIKAFVVLIVCSALTAIPMIGCFAALAVLAAAAYALVMYILLLIELVQATSYHIAEQP